MVVLPVDEGLEARLRQELRWVRETRIALERMGMLTLERAVELEREEARIRHMLYELETSGFDELVSVFGIPRAGVVKTVGGDEEKAER